MRKIWLVVLLHLLLFNITSSAQELIIQPPVIAPFGCTEFYTLFTGTVTNFSKNTFSTYLFGEVSYTNPSGQSGKLAEVVFRGMPSINFNQGVLVISGSNFNSIYVNRKITFFDKNHKRGVT